MADPVEPVKDDQYELGNTDYVIETPDKPPVAKETPSGESSASPVIDIGERPRDEKGRFLPSQTVTAAAVAPLNPPAPERPPSYLIEAARDFGLTDEEIFAMPPAVLAKTMWQAKRAMDNVRQQLSRQQTVQDGQVRNPEPQQPQAPDDLDFEVTEEVHPTIATGLNNLRAQVKAQRDQNKSLLQEVQQLRSRDQQRELNRAAAIYDAAFQALGLEYEPVLGKGAGRDMDNSSAEYKRRIAVLTEAGADPRVLTPGQIKAKVKAAAELLYPRSPAKAAADAYAEVDPKANGKPRISEKEWNEAGLARPTARKVDDEPPSEQKAVRKLQEKMNQASDVIPDSEELEGFF